MSAKSPELGKHRVRALMENEMNEKGLAKFQNRFISSRVLNGRGRHRRRRRRTHNIRRPQMVSDEWKVN